MSNLDSNRKFGGDILVSDPLDAAIEWIQTNLGPNDVFAELELIEWVRRHLNPGDVFGEMALKNWAEDNGYVKE